MQVRFSSGSGEYAVSAHEYAGFWTSGAARTGAPKLRPPSVDRATQMPCAVSIPARYTSPFGATARLARCGRTSDRETIAGADHVAPWSRLTLQTVVARSIERLRVNAT